MYTKSAEWDYEQEIRVFARNNILPINSESIREIQFGCESSVNDQNDIINIVNQYNYQNVSFLKATKSMTDFKLDLVQI